MAGAIVLKMAFRQSKSCLKLTEWRALIIALIMAVSIASLMAVLGERIEKTLMRQGSALLGGELILTNSRPLSRENLSYATDLGLDYSEVTQLATMANSGDNFLLVTIRALSFPYPRGTIELEQPSSNTLPETGEVWAEAGVFERLDLNIGDHITLGNKSFKLSGLIRSAPDRGRGFISFNPQLIMNQDDIFDTGLMGPGARMRYRQLFAGDAEAVSKMETYLDEQLQTGERLTSLSDDEGQQNSALTKASSYLRLGALFALLISAMTIFLSLRRFTQSQNTRAALLKSLGLSDLQLLRLYLYQIAIAWSFSSVIGVMLAALLEVIGLNLLSSLLPQPVPSADPFTYLSGPVLGASILLCLGLPTLLKLKQSNPIQLIQGQAGEIGWQKKTPYVIAAVLLILFTSSYLNNLTLTLSLIATLLVTGGLLGWIGARGALLIVKYLAPRHRLGNLLLSRVQQQQRWYRLQIPVICLLFALLSINFIALNDLLSRWQQQLPEDTPNHFLINIQDWEKNEVETLLQGKQINSQLWPIYRGRLVQVNDLPLAQALTPEQLAQPSLRRELNLTSANQIPVHNKLVTGNWQDKNAVSIEEKEAEELGLELGDKITFDVAGEKVSAEITSIRRVRWDSFQPNFYFIFSPDVLEGLTASYLTSFHLGSNSAEVSRELITQFPTLTLIDVRQLLEQIQQLLSRLSLLSSLLMLLTTAAGLVLLYVTLTQELEQRRFENSLLQTLGASTQQCRQLDRLEMGLIGAISGLLAVLISELSLWPIHQQLLQLEVTLHPMLWVVLPLTSTLLFLIVGSVSHRQHSLSESYKFLLSRQ
jgi:putative ABC transport system permease protein